MGHLPHGPLGCCLPPGREAEGQGPRVSPGKSPTHFGHLLPNSPSDSEDGWRHAGDRPSGSSCQLLSCSVTRLCGHPINADNSIWHRIPVETAGHQGPFIVLKTNRTPSLQRPPVPPPLPIWVSFTCPWSSSAPLIPGCSLLCIQISAPAGWSSGERGPGSRGEAPPCTVTHRREACRPS